MGNQDVFGVNGEFLKNKKLFLFDMDGTIYEEDKIFDGTNELLKQIKTMGGEYVFVTNNSSKSVKEYLKKVRALGISAELENFFTSAQATALYLQEKYPQKIVYCQGTRSLVDELTESGINIVTDDREEVDVVLVGFDTELTSDKIRKTCKLLQEKVAFIATNPDLVCPVSFGFVPDCGSICQMLENATGKKPKYIGKPQRTMVDIVRKNYGFSLAETVIIGDRLYTDIAAGINAGVTSICVLTGEATVTDIQKGNIHPTLTFNSVKDIWRLLAS